MIRKNKNMVKETAMNEKNTLPGKSNKNIPIVRKGRSHGLAGRNKRVMHIAKRTVAIPPTQRNQSPVWEDGLKGLVETGGMGASRELSHFWSYCRRSCALLSTRKASMITFTFSPFLFFSA